MGSNFEFLAKYWPDMAQIGKMAELYLYTDPNACVYKTGLLAERVAQEICGFENMELPAEISHADRIRRLKYADLLPKRIDDMFYTLRKARNDAVHSGLNSRERADLLLHMAFNLCCWFMEVYGDWNFAAPEYRTPEDTSKASDYAQRLNEQEKKIQELLEAVEEIKTAASSASKDDRNQKAEEAAQKLPLTQEEAECIAQNPVRIDMAVLPVINYALQQNGIDAVQSVTLINDTDQDVENADLRIWSTPEFTLPFVRHVECLPAHKSVELNRIKLTLNAEYLAATTERISGVMEISLSGADGVIANDTVETAVLPFDQWHGTSFYPELLASFVTPNHPETAKIIARATEFLGQWTGDTSMDAYQTQDPNRVLSQAAAIFTAIKEQGIAYAVPPASFEAIGQRVRMCDTIMQQKLGTCLDLTLFYAACLEAAGLYPLLITTPNHIFTGVWIQNRMFSESVQDDVSLITKRLASGVNEIAVVETTCVTTGRDVSFDDARMSAEHTLIADPVEYIIDVHRARLSGVHPLPQRVHTDSGWQIQHAVSFREDTMTAPRKLNETVEVEPAVQEGSIPKMVQWERKLLDLGMRNTLINLRLSKTQLPILTTSLDELENALSDGSDFAIMPRPSDWRVPEISFEAMGEMGADSLIQAEFQNKRLRSVYTDAELEKALKNLYRTAKTAMEENGANTLYLALGMLRWYENKRSTQPRYAPIILLPVDLIRKSAAQGYVIRLRDDDPQMNITLLEKLKQDFGIVVAGLDPLPLDEHGINIRKVLTIMRKAVMEQTHWDVLETATIGIFSFSQFVMWNDIRNRTDDLVNNKIVRSLMEGKLAWEAKPLEMGDRVPEKDVLLPMPADASQLFAIEAACEGESFVLHGPPGTGKSQTITSLIANALAKGKSVLFVAEKMAALEVVQKRLDKIGIGPFCLELHSNKSKKRDVLEQLRQATEVTKTTTAQEFAQKAQQLANMRAELDAYAEQLHKERTCGSSLYELMNAYELYKDAPEMEPFSRQFVGSLTKSDIEKQTIVLERMIAAAKAIGHPHNHPLEAVGCVQYSQQLKNDLAPAAKAYLAEIKRISSYAEKLTGVWEQPGISDFAGLQRLSQIADNMVCWYQMPGSWAQTDAPELYFRKVTEMAQHFLNADKLKTELMEIFGEDILTQSGEQLLAEYVEVSGKWFLPKLLGTNKLRKQLNLFAKSPIQKDSLQAYITLLRDYQQENNAGTVLLEEYGRSLEFLNKGNDSDWNQIRLLAEQAQSSTQMLRSTFGNCDFQHTHCGNPQERDAVYGLQESFPVFQKAKTDFETLLSIGESTAEHWLSQQAEQCCRILNHAGELKEWIAFRNASQEAEAVGLKAVADCYRSGESHENILPIYRKALLYGLISDAIDSSDVLNAFSGAVFNEKIEQYRRADQQWRELSQQEAYCRLASKVPDFTREAAHSSELGILQRCIKSGGRGVSIRKLFDQIPNLLPRLCPCMLMSPISAAQYLDPKREPFDIVVFDEASQLPTCKAVGVLARGKNAVVVGDPKQMPPTSFFAVNTVDEDHIEEEDLESILDDCLALNMPQAHLLWHYRSRHESLIAFSNSHFYENKLFTFPSVNDRESKVRLIHVDGVFERGKTRTNRAEAEAVIEELKRRCADGTGQSVGVVTFNSSQQNLIDDLLNEACAKDPELEKWAYESEEPVFIKNLENVQGDERDVILFSVGYGPDESGKVYMNFGPLNRDGGWRRLNVAVSRARSEMMVFSTLRADQIDLSRTKAEGVAALRAFLEYADGKELAMSEDAVQSRAYGYNGIADSICRALNEKGYDTELSVGRSQYRIDIGIVNPQNPDEYLLGIMLDGTSYGAAKTTRDRELAQVGVLRGLGWNIMRIWCMDWWDNPSKELNRIFLKLSEIEKEPQNPGKGSTCKKEKVSESVNLQQKAARPQVIAENKNNMAVRSAPVYRAAALQEVLISSDEFTDYRYERGIQSKILQVLNAEAPVSESALIRRVVQSYGIARAGSRIQSHMDNILKKMSLNQTRQEDTLFYWRADQNPNAYSGYRVSGEEDSRRDVRDVPIQEIANAVCVVLYEQFSMEQEDLLRETAKKLGYTRLGGNVLAALNTGIGYAQKKGEIAEGSNGALTLTKEGTVRAEETIAAFQN